MKERSDPPADPRQLDLPLPVEITVTRAGRNHRYKVLERDGVEVTRENL